MPKPDQGAHGHSITVFRGSPPTNAYVWSPFVTKLEARLRFGGVSYGLGGGSPPSAPKGKIPYVEIQQGGSKESLGDSGLIIRALVSNGIVRDANAPLTPTQKTHDLAVRSVMEDRVYFYGTREKWCDNYTVMRSNVLSAVPWPLQVIVGWLAYRGVASGLHGQGTGRLTDEEVLAFKEEVWESVDALVVEARQSASGNGPFWLLGLSEPTEADATLYGFIVGALVCDAAPVTAKIVKGYPTIVEYAERIHDQYFPDYQKW
ncbi:glutathione s-transferase [Purpureocillium lavendulum]|uniref:Glutathione s-transferase n=1 Tax=Purpureocillium lavendulum TaxID=1247861 RepID=A0AB34FR73_9HYPO|nr:glutathione s-transferase [Purpureocillium lavendulum]